jgi:hypothetical protein
MPPAHEYPRRPPPAQWEGVIAELAEETHASELKHQAGVLRQLARELRDQNFVAGEARLKASSARAKSVRSLTIAAVDIQLLMRWSALQACAPVGAPRMFWSAAERD